MKTTAELLLSAAILVDDVTDMIDLVNVGYGRCMKSCLYYNKKKKFYQSTIRFMTIKHRPSDLENEVKVKLCYG